MYIKVSPRVLTLSINACQIDGTAQIIYEQNQLNEATTHGKAPPCSVPKVSCSSLPALKESYGNIIGDRRPLEKTVLTTSAWLAFLRKILNHSACLNAVAQ